MAKKIFLILVFSFYVSKLSFADATITCAAQFQFWMETSYIPPQLEGYGYGKLNCVDGNGNQKVYDLQVNMDAANFGLGINSAKDDPSPGRIDPVKVSSPFDISGNYRGSTLSVLEKTFEMPIKNRATGLTLFISVAYDMGARAAIIPANWKLVVKDIAE